MKRIPFTDGWRFREKVNPFAEIGGPAAPYEPVLLPHDASIGRARDPQGEAAAAYFRGGAYQYRAEFETPAGAPHVVFEFEGVYRDAMVYINGDFAGQRPSGYASFTVDAGPLLRPVGESNEILVEARAHRDSRWYTGAGIYRPVWQLTGGEVHIPADGLRVSTPDAEASGATVEVAVTVENSGSRMRTVDVEVTVTDPDGATVASGVARVTTRPGTTALSRQRLHLATPALWSEHSPALYRATARLLGDGRPMDEAEAVFGVRRLQLDPVNGLRVNGETVKLRGACVHHDNGLLGAATFASAEERRVRLLKEAGFNAIRSSHNPLSSAMLDACDRLGVYVMDETFDVWTSAKSDFDYSLHFPEWWERDVESMVVKDYNHPSVIFYSIGNEIPETGSAVGGMLGRELAEKVRSLDSTRFVTNAVNGMLAVIDDVKRMAAERAAAADGGAAAGAEAADGGAGAEEGAGINTLMAGPGDFMNLIGASPLVTEKTAESFGVLDVAGMNYLDARYASDRELFPNRVIVGTETFPTQIDRNWALVTEYGHVIGDFTWTGWDYLGEVGIGRPQYLDAEHPEPSIAAPYPWIAAWCGDLDIIGHRRPASFYREIVFGLRGEPYIAVVRPRDGDATFYAGPWTWSDSISSWTWPGQEGSPLTVEVYSDAEEVELLLDGISLGRRAAGPGNRFRAEFEVEYRAGELTAVAWRGGVASERFGLRSAEGAVEVRVTAEPASMTAADGLVFVAVELVDAQGTAVTGPDRAVTVSIAGTAALQSFGSANPAPDTAWGSPTQCTFDGRALAIVRLEDDSESVVTVSADGCPSVELTLGRAAPRA
ncbi:glycoside hydrolase family 2 TIM barrel-domain containing protein [Herbiconiux sp.]|uniref:glycoside hydrolase family 2 TIM barrel-domain containing protein n=1 Tax=Herbiconiux sp. TaxID=1871186 RepID=UPI0025BA6491|nr:glycoside hydrolase family 2 TIM barrel-domain containing protein [Herbiconiux sp.]